MDRSSTGAPGVYSGERQASVSSFLTSIVLLAGVVGGLVIVLTVILVCRYCQGQGQRKPLTRQTSRSSRRDNWSDQQSKYDYFYSDILSEPSSCSVHGSSLTPRSLQHFRYPEKVGDPEFATETSPLKCDFSKDDYTEAGQVRGQVKPQVQASESGSLDPSPQTVEHGGEDGSRYNEGDYHHLKHSKIGRSLPRQFSMGGAGSAVQGRTLLDDTQFRFSSLDERLTTHAGVSPDSSVDVQRVIRESHHLQLQPPHLQQPQLQHPLQQLTHVDKDVLRHSREGQPTDEHFALCRDKRESPSLNCRVGRSTVASLSSMLPSLKEDTKSSSLPSVRPIADFPPSLFSLYTRRGEDASSVTSSQFKPIKEGGRSAFTIHRPVRTQVSVEVHQHSHNRDGGNHSANSSEELHQRLLGRLDRACSQAFSSASAHLSQRHGLTRPVNSHSLESPRQSSYRDSRQVRSYDDYLEDYDVLKITEFSKGPFYNTDYDIISELASPTSSKVRYNDTGSPEQLDEDTSTFVCGLEFEDLAKMEDSRDQDHSEDTEDSAETLNGNRKYRALWRLRATLEEEEECSDTVRMEDLTSPDDSFEREHVTPNTTSFESNAQSEPCPSDHRDSGIQFEIATVKPFSHVNFLHPNYENRRQNYRNVMSGRFKRGNQSTSVENSFDSVETDGDISDTSRYEMTTTSFESSTTTDNTDSTNESQASKLVQMKADSGYKSLETQQQSSKEMGDHEAAKWGFRASVECGEGIAARRDRRTSLERGEMACYAFGQPGAVGLIGDSGLAYPHKGLRRSSGTSAQPRCDTAWRPIHSASHFTRRDVKTASKKRREYSRERQLVHVCESIHEPATELRADVPARERPEDSTAPNKISVFARFFRSHPRGHRSQYLVRDYSIDQKTNSIFNEFVRQEIPQAVTESGSMPRLNRHRLQRKHTEPMLFTEGRATTRDRLAPGMRSASLGSESSASSARRLSPQDSIEEKDDEMADETIFLHRLPVWSSFRSPELNLMSRQVQTLSIHDIPVIKLSEQEVPEIS